MTMLRLRIICAGVSSGAVTGALARQVGVIGVRRAGSTSHGAEVTAALARESADEALAELRRLGVYETGRISLQPLDTAVGPLATRAEGDAPGEGADAMIWDELASRTGEDSTL